MNLGFDEFIKYQAYLENLLKIKYTDYYRNHYTKSCENDTLEDITGYLERCEFYFHRDQISITDDMGDYTVKKNEVSFVTHKNPIGFYKLTGTPDDYQITYPDKPEHQFNFDVRYREKEPANPIMLASALFFWSNYKIPDSYNQEDQDEEIEDDLVKPIDEIPDTLIKVMTTMANKYSEDINKSNLEVETYNEEARKKEEELKLKEKQRQDHMDNILKESKESLKRKADLSTEIKITGELFETYKKKVILVKEANELTLKVEKLNARKDVLTNESNLSEEVLKEKINAIDSELKPLKERGNSVINELKTIQSAMEEKKSSDK